MKSESQIPNCVGIIMDGNRRWAEKKGLPTFEGHRCGHKKFKDLNKWVKEFGVKNLIIYAFSTENWNRSEQEVSYFLDLFRIVLDEDMEKMKEDDVRIIFIGDLSRFPDDLRRRMENITKDTKDNGGYTLVVAASYGGRTEILHAVNRTLVEDTREGVHAITEKEFASYLWTADVPDPDLIIRTGGEKRLSNFLTWQSIYSELYFSDTYWPDFSKKEFESILKDFASRERRIGK